MKIEKIIFAAAKKKTNSKSQNTKDTANPKFGIWSDAEDESVTLDYHRMVEPKQLVKLS